MPLDFPRMHYPAKAAHSQPFAFLKCRFHNCHISYRWWHMCLGALDKCRESPGIGVVQTTAGTLSESFLLRAPLSLRGPLQGMVRLSLVAYRQSITSLAASTHLTEKNFCS